MENNNTNTGKNFSQATVGEKKFDKTEPIDSALPGQDIDELEEKHAKGERQGNSSIPLENDETIGIP